MNLHLLPCLHTWPAAQNLQVRVGVIVKWAKWHLVPNLHSLPAAQFLQVRVGLGYSKGGGEPRGGPGGVLIVSSRRRTSAAAGSVLVAMSSLSCVALAGSITKPPDSCRTQLNSGSRRVGQLGVFATTFLITSHTSKGRFSASCSRIFRGISSALAGGSGGGGGEGGGGGVGVIGGGRGEGFLGG